MQVSCREADDGPSFEERAEEKMLKKKEEFEAAAALQAQKVSTEPNIRSLRILRSIFISRSGTLLILRICHVGF